jgi:hypothetical protein
MREIKFRLMFRIKRFTHHLRYRDYANSPEHVIPAALTVSDGADSAVIQAAIDRVSGTDTPNYAIYQQDLATYNATWYRWFIRKPFWVRGGQTVLGRGEYTLTTTLHLPSNVIIRGEGADATFLVLPDPPDRIQPDGGAEG